MFDCIPGFISAEDYERDRNACSIYTWFTFRKFPRINIIFDAEKYTLLTGQGMNIIIGRRDFFYKFTHWTIPIKMKTYFGLWKFAYILFSSLNVPWKWIEGSFQSKKTEVLELIWQPIIATRVFLACQRYKFLHNIFACAYLTWQAFICNEFKKRKSLNHKLIEVQYSQNGRRLVLTKIRLIYK